MLAAHCSAFFYCVEYFCAVPGFVLNAFNTDVQNRCQLGVTPLGTASIPGGNVRGERSCLDKQILCQELEAQTGSGVLNVLFNISSAPTHGSECAACTQTAGISALVLSACTDTPDTLGCIREGTLFRCVTIVNDVSRWNCQVT